MNTWRVLLLIPLVLPPAQVAAQNDRELYHAEVCNVGELAFNVAVASTNFGVFDEYWDVYGWHPIHSGECQIVFSHWYAPQNLFSYQAFPVHLAFAFKDSTGVWGAALVAAPEGDDVSRSRVRLCVADNEGFAYEVHAKDPQRQCSAAGYSLIPASIVWEPTEPARYPSEWNPEWGPPMRFNVALGVGDRAIPTGAQAPPPAVSQAPAVPRAKARLIFGEELTALADEWSFANGGLLPDNLIDPNTGLPPLLPKYQYSTASAPVAGYLAQIQGVLSSFQTCRTTDFVHDVVSPQFAMDDYGVVVATETDRFANMQIQPSRGVAIANLNLEAPRIVELGPSCINFVLSTRGGAWSVRHTQTGATTTWSFVVNTRENGEAILNALRAIAPYYPDGTGDITREATP
jgi:hypothetical protein